MSRTFILSLAGGLAIALAGTVYTFAQNSTPPGASLRPAESFSAITNERERAAALFTEMGKVLQHPRCVNCHPVGDRPRQGDIRKLHEPLVVRGKDGHGAPGMQCTTCHGKQNYDPARVPGDGHWALAPASMAWEGKTIGQICEQIKDRERNGNRNLAALIKHVTTDTLVLWGWSPGAGREPAPGTPAEFGRLMQAWADSGASCPSP